MRTGHQLPRWPLFLVAAPAAVAIWSGWVGLSGMCGFGPVNLLPGSGAASAIASALVTILIAIGCASASRPSPGSPIVARPVYQLPPEPRPQLEGSHIPAVGRGRELHIHLHGLTPGQMAAIVTRSYAYLKEDQ
jgi:hypothetical protein